MPVWLIILISVVGLLILLMVRSYMKLKNASNDGGSEHLLHLTDTDFQKKISTGVTLVDFWAGWCMPCKLLGPTISQLADDNAGNAKIAKLDVEESQRTASKYGVSSIPTVILFKNGKEINRIVGVKPKQHYQSLIDKALK
ncbi:hypothetical protein SDC9_39316 [bioreactor metagenome]|uniref:Thioredoxin domain-containing protein n=1 Tax=bioreactor metagenome TaxID=1076179 RepID=A0A644VPQ6_9ZZZZ